MPPFSHILQYLILFAEITLVKAFETFAVAGFVFCHFMHGVMDSIQSCCFSAAGQIEFTCGSAVFGFYTHFQILLSGVGNDFA